MAIIEQVCNAMHAHPFRPSTVHLVDGRTYFVKHPDFIAVSAHRRRPDLTIHDDAGPHFLDLGIVVEIHPQPAAATSGP
jgi:hypothetical protein